MNIVDVFYKDINYVYFNSIFLCRKAPFYTKKNWLDSLHREWLVSRIKLDLFRTLGYKK